MTPSELQHRHDGALRLTRDAGVLALEFFRRLETLSIERKGPQDFVSQADREVELHLRRALEETFPDDGIVGEEHAPVEGRSGFTWIIDPIDGTTNFINAIPAWTVVLAGVQKGRTRIGVIDDPCHGETFSAISGAGAWLNGTAMRASTGRGLNDGTISVGMSNRTGIEGTLSVLGMVMRAGGLYHRNASGALSLAYVAAGRLLGYMEEHMNAWDCLAGQLMVVEAGGAVEEQDADGMIAHGGRVVAGSREVFPSLIAFADGGWPSSPAAPPNHDPQSEGSPSTVA